MTKTLRYTLDQEICVTQSQDESLIREVHRERFSNAPVYLVATITRFGSLYVAVRTEDTCERVWEGDNILLGRDFAKRLRPENIRPPEKEVYWTGLVPSLDDFGNTIHDEFVDGMSGPEYRGVWGLFTPEAWQAFGIGRLGTGLGQRYRRQDDGRWLKVEG